MSSLYRGYYRALALLSYGHLVRSGDGWRFGAARIGHGTVERLIENGKATHLFPGEADERVIARIV